ncbi:hypothetical protein [Mitsuaria sp. 7]|uniref:hypothetical protein n=1 Tax=Mitsuaria sp. 7 TaxID=1658665 RepID=UPI0007DD72FF|nr:hypothetical protein [Mitsuaria sp. 7]ANH69743.1 hypothetical protein ABE85_23060 [Mitsuaria sp. 7]
MNPWEIAARVCRPMSTEEARRLTQQECGSKEYGDTDPLLEAEIQEMLARIRVAERAERERAGKS